MISKIAIVVSAVVPLSLVFLLAMNFVDYPAYTRASQIQLDQVQQVVLDFKAGAFEESCEAFETKIECLIAIYREQNVHRTSALAFTFAFSMGVSLIVDEQLGEGDPKEAMASLNLFRWVNFMFEQALMMRRPSRTSLFFADHYERQLQNKMVRGLLMSVDREFASHDLDRVIATIKSQPYRPGSFLSELVKTAQLRTEVRDYFRQTESDLWVSEWISALSEN